MNKNGEPRIYKYPLIPTDLTHVVMPSGSKVLTVQTQNGQPCLWALVDPESPPEERTFVIYGTGHPIDPKDCVGGDYIGTFQLAAGALVFHVFERPA